MVALALSLLGDSTLYCPDVQTENCAVAVLSLGAGDQADGLRLCFHMMKPPWGSGSHLECVPSLVTASG